VLEGSQVGQGSQTVEDRESGLDWRRGKEHNQAEEDRESGLDWRRGKEHSQAGREGRRMSYPEVELKG